MKLSGWGNHPVIESKVVNPKSFDEIKNITKDHESMIPRGLGRSYGDSSLNPHLMLGTSNLNRYLEFKPKSGLLTCESGIILAELIDIFLPRGWFIPVTPGTKFVTIGGMIASDVHGKNHHKHGSFSSFVIDIKLLLASGKVVNCSSDENAELFYATLGGMGLTGLIISATFQLIPVETAFIRQETIRAKNLQEIIQLLQSSENWTYTVSWIDCLSRGDSFGRSILMRGEHAKTDELNNKIWKKAPLKLPKVSQVSVPFFFPSWLLNTFSVKIFNALYYGKSPKQLKSEIIPCTNFFYPLDAVLNWNRIYGRKGFTQWQCLVPRTNGEEILTKILDVISQSGQGSFLAVLKLLGPQDGVLAFPDEGYTLALDFSIKESLFPLLNQLDKILDEYGGRVYMSKDVRMNKEFFQRTYGDKVSKFIKIKNQVDPKHKFQSLQSQRLGL